MYDELLPSSDSAGKLHMIPKYRQIGKQGERIIIKIEFFIAHSIILILIL